MRFACKTYFDITATRVTGHYKSSRVPFHDNVGVNVEDEASWNRARNQQRNWETITQVIGLRTQLFKLEEPTQDKQVWSFEFEVETPDAFGPEDNPTALLLSDADGVPMITGLNEKSDISPLLTVTGDKQNIWFSALL